MITPCGHTVLVKVETAETQTDWGFVTTTNSDQKRLEQAGQVIGTLTAVGPQYWKAFSIDFTGEPWAKVGDKVLFARYSGKSVEDPFTGDEYYIMNDEDIRAVITEE